MQEECVICSGPVTYAHLGLNACRPCAMFYNMHFRRANESKTELKCKEGDGECMQLNQKSTCRLCRFTKISDILKKASGEPVEITEETAKKDCNESETLTFINHESFYDCEPSTSQTPLLDRIRKGYSLMCLIRHGGELGTRTKIDESVQVHVGKQVLVPAAYKTFPMHSITCKEAMKAFANHAFEDFRMLDDDCKDFVIKTSHSVLNALDTIYRSMHHFPEDDEMRTPGYTTYVRPRDLEKTFFSDCSDDVDVEKIAGEIRKSLETTVNVARRYYKRLKPTDYEFLALFGISLWNDGAEIADLSDELSKIAMRNRASIMRELHAYYLQQGQGTINYGVRIGHLFCIAMTVQKNTTKLREDFEFYRLHNLFKEYMDTNCK